MAKAKRTPAVEAAAATDPNAPPTGFVALNQGKCIIVVQAGWVLQGDCTTRENGDVDVMNAHCVREWATDHGLGYIAMQGPKAAKAVLDKMGKVHIPLHAVLFVIECEVPRWEADGY